MKYLTLALFLGAIAFGLYIHFAETPIPQSLNEAQNMMTIEEYVRKNISTLSPERPVLGGTFYITDVRINTDAQTGTVWYEDGHIALVADFAYTRDNIVGYKIDRFDIRKRKDSEEAPLEESLSE